MLHSQSLYLTDIILCTSSCAYEKSLMIFLIVTEKIQESGGEARGEHCKMSTLRQKNDRIVNC